MSKIVVMVLVCAAIAVVACRREEPVIYRPLKLGGPIVDQPKQLDGLSSKQGQAMGEVTGSE